MKDYKQTFEKFKMEWALTNPPPERDRPPLVNFMQFLLFAPMFLIGPIVSAFRTAALISQHTAFHSAKAVLWETLLCTFFIEWGVIAHQVERLRRLNHKKIKVGVGLVWAGLISAIGAVAVSNLVQIGVAALRDAGVVWTTAAGADLLKVVPAVFIGLFYGIGVVVMTTVAGEVVGRFVLEYQAADAKCAEAHSRSMREWQARLAKDWNSRKGRLLSDRDATHYATHPDASKVDAAHDAGTFSRRCAQCGFTASTAPEWAAHVRWSHAPMRAHDVSDASQDAKREQA